MLKPLIAIALLANAAAAQAAEPPCLTEAEFRSVGLFMLPPIVDSAASRCEAHLPGGAYLLTGARRMAETVAREREGHKQVAIATLIRLSGNKVPEGFSGETIAGVVADMMRTQLITKVSADDCARIDEATTLLAPLPPENLVGLVGLMVREGMKGDREPPFRICAAAKI